MDLSNILSLIVLVVVVFLAFRIGAVLMKVLLGLLAIALIFWLVSGLIGGADAAVAGFGPLLSARPMSAAT